MGPPRGSAGNGGTIYLIRGFGAKLRLWMGLAVSIDQLRGVDMRVSLSRAQARVAQQFLNGAQIRPCFEQVCREGVPQRVRTDAVAGAALADIAAHQLVDAARRQPGPLVIQKQRLANPAACPGARHWSGAGSSLR